MTARGSTAAALPITGATGRPGALRTVLRLAAHKPLGALGAVLIVGFVAVALLADLVAPYEYDEPDPFARLRAPGAVHWLGTDNLGRDVLSRVLYGARVSMAVGFGAVALGTLGAAVVGVSSGFLGGKVDVLLQRLVDAFMCFPLLLVALTLMALLGPGLANVILTLGLVLAVRDSRVVRSAVLAVKASPFVEAAVALGANRWRLIHAHALPNIAAPLLVLATVDLGWVILIEAALSFLGFGIPPPRPSWGGMLSGAGLYHMYRAPWLAVWPGVTLSLAVFGVNMLGDALRDVLDPRLRGA